MKDTTESKHVKEKVGRKQEILTSLVDFDNKIIFLDFLRIIQQSIHFITERLIIERSIYRTP